VPPPFDPELPPLKVNEPDKNESPHSIEGAIRKELVFVWIYYFVSQLSLKVNTITFSNSIEKPLSRTNSSRAARGSFFPLLRLRMTFENKQINFYYSISLSKGSSKFEDYGNVVTLK